MPNADESTVRGFGEEWKTFDHGDRGDHKGHSFAAPEIDPSSAISALTLLLGSVVVLRSRVATKR